MVTGGKCLNVSQLVSYSHTPNLEMLSHLNIDFSFWYLGCLKMQHKGGDYFFNKFSYNLNNFCQLIKKMAIVSFYQKHDY